MPRTTHPSATAASRLNIPPPSEPRAAEDVDAEEDEVSFRPELPPWVLPAVGYTVSAIVGLGLGYLVELADRSFRKPDEVVREFGLPILGHVPYMKTQQKKKGTPNHKHK